MTRYTVKVLPRSSRNQVEEVSSNELRVKLTAPPVEGKANASLIKVLAKHFGVRPSRITIRSGTTSRQKIIEIGH